MFFLIVIGCDKPVEPTTQTLETAQLASATEAGQSDEKPSESTIELANATDEVDTDRKPVLPMPKISDPLTEEEMKTPVDEFVGPDRIAGQEFLAPKGAKQLSKSNLWIDPKQKRVYADGYIAMTEGPLEMFACPMGTKEHESVVATLAKAKEIHTALLAIGAQQGTPVAFQPKFVPATGQRIRVWVCYYDQDEKYHVADARTWIREIGTEKVLKTDWVFGGSSVWTDPSDGRSYYQADVGDMICVSNFSTAMLDLPVASSADAGALLYSPFTEKIPERGHPIRLVLDPIPLATDENKGKVEMPKPPTQDLLLLRRKAGRM